MKKFVLLTAEGQVNFDSLSIGHDYIVSRPFDWKELQVWIQQLVNRRASREELPNRIEVASADELLRNRIIKIVEENIGNPDFSIDVFAREMGMSTAQLYRKLVGLTGYAPNDFIRHMRLQRAADLFMQKAGNVSEIGYKVGFNNLSYFSKCFKEKFGTLPSSYLGSVVAI